jgi:hypothetical protein
MLALFQSPTKVISAMLILLLRTKVLFARLVVWTQGMPKASALSEVQES